jgi:hypothetical protein
VVVEGGRRGAEVLNSLLINYTMDGLDKEIAELKEFVADLKADRVAQKEKEKREAWTKYTSISIVFIAVLAAVATQLAGKYSGRTLVALNKATFSQAKASDKWGEFQANSIKRNLYETLRQAAPKDTTVSDAEAATRDKAFADKIAKYEQNQKQKETEANDLEKQRDECMTKADDSSAHGGSMGTAVSIFQISIALGSICIVAKKKWLWYISMLLAAAATFKMVMVWLT